MKKVSLYLLILLLTFLFGCANSDVIETQVSDASRLIDILESDALPPLNTFPASIQTHNIPIPPPSKTFVLEDSEYPDSWFTALTLRGESRFWFGFFSFKSVIHVWDYFAEGYRHILWTYSIEDYRLILKTEGRVEYVFSIEEDALVFIASESRRPPSFRTEPCGVVPIPVFEDGARFVLNKICD